MGWVLGRIRVWAVLVPAEEMWWPGLVGEGQGGGLGASPMPLTTFPSPR